MSRKPQTTDLVIVPLWTRAQAEKASPYLASMLRSLREAMLDAKQHSLTAERLASRPGRPSRASRIAHAEAIRDASRARDVLHESIEELQSLGINCLDPLRGEALVPFITDEHLAWFIYDLFAEEPVRYWRFHTDPLEMRRPIEAIGQRPAAEASASGPPRSADPGSSGRAAGDR
jgi:hypothetical protein